MKTVDPYKKVCKYEFCLEEFIAKRTNQEFCCNNHYVRHNNLKAKRIRDAVKTDDKILHANRAILNSLCKKEVFISKDNLTSLGYRLNYYTKILRLEEGKIIYSCYDFLIERADDKTLKIYKNE